MRGQSTPQLRDREWLNCVQLSPVILEELQQHSPYQPPHEMAQQVMPRLVHMTNSFRGIEFTTYTLSNTVAGADYVAVAGEELVFHHGSTRVCHTIDTLQDNTCENDSNKFFISGLANVRGVQIYIYPSTAQVVIDDTAEPECFNQEHKGSNNISVPCQACQGIHTCILLHFHSPSRTTSFFHVQCRFPVIFEHNQRKMSRTKRKCRDVFFCMQSDYCEALV